MTSLVRVRHLFDDESGDFNHAAAEAAYGAIMKCEDYDEASVLASMILGACLSHTLVVNREEIGKAYVEAIQARVVVLGKALVEKAVTVARDGGDATRQFEQIEALEQVSKALGGAYDPNDFEPNPMHRRIGQSVGAGMSSAQRAAHARQQKRDLLTGRFVQEHKNITHVDSEKALHPKDAQIIGIPVVPANIRLTSRQLAHYQRGYREVADMIAPYTELNPSAGVLHLNYTTGQPDLIGFPAKGQLKVKEVNRDGTVAEEGIDPKRKLASASLSVLPASTLQSPQVQATFGAALGEEGLLNADTWDPSTSGSFGDEMTRTIESEAYTPGARAMRRAGTLSRAIEATLPDSLLDRMPHAQLALQVGHQVGQVGPEAAKVIGPTADRAAYRYRGTERKTVDSRLQNAVASIRLSPNIRQSDKREAMIHGMEDDQANWQAGGVLNYFRSRLPRADLNTLQRKSGTIPPSEGVIIDKNGRIATQAVGFGDDHYLPFNLKNLTKLRGGEYLRTRTFGGPTTEDIYTGLVGGARSLTVVSHNGVYTMEFDKDLKGGRRFNDKAAKMVSRYGQLLDAVKSEQVTTGGIHPSRVAELEERAGRMYDQDREPERYQAELEQLKRAELRRPQFSATQRQEAASEWLSLQAEKRSTADGHVMTAEDLTNDIALRRASSLMATIKDANPTAQVSLTTLQRDVVAQMTDADPVKAVENVATSLGQERSLAAYMTKAETDYRKSLTPLQLNSQGYELALTALQEQFPYYIDRIDFHPWTEGATGNAFDTGYVAPKHNRPHAVLAGYFDAKVLGHGKVHADSIRNQNRGVRQGKLDLVETAASRAQRATGQTAGSRIVSGPVDPVVAATLKQDAARNLIADLRAKTTFSPRAMAAPGAPAIANLSVADFLDPLKQSGAANNLHDILASPMEDLERRLAEEPTKLYATLNAALRENEAKQLLDVTPTARRNFVNEGRVELPKEIGSDAAVKLNDPEGTEYDIPGSVFSQDHQHSTVDIINAYDADPAIRPLISEGLLPPTLAEGASFQGKVNELRTTLKGQRISLATWNAKRSAGRDVGREPVVEHTLNRQAEGLLRAQQLRRRYTEAQQREAIVAPANVGETVEYHLHVPDQETAESLRGQLPGPQ